jgi:hypothetical protein
MSKVKIHLYSNHATVHLCEIYPDEVKKIINSSAELAFLIF